MKKNLLIGWLILLTACQNPTPTPAVVPSPSATVPPTQIPVTDTPTLMPTPAPTTTPFPRFFINEFDTVPVSWSLLQAGSGAVPTLKSENSALLLQMDAPFTWAYAIYGAQDYENVRIEARFANQAGSPASIGLVCRYSESGDWFEYNISTDGSYNVLYGQWLADGVADYVPVLSAASNAILPSGTLQEIGLICSGTTLSLLIDQNIIRNVDVSRFELTGGKIGITGSSFENIPVIAAFDWVRVSEP